MMPLRPLVYPPLAPAQGLAQSAGQDIHTAHDPMMLVGAAPVLAHEAHRMRIVHHDQRAVFVGQVADVGQVRDVAVHREHAVCGNQAKPCPSRLLQLCLQVLHIAVQVAIALRLAQPHAINDAGVVQFVGNDGVLRPEQGLEQAAVGVETRGVKNGVFGAQELS